MANSLVATASVENLPNRFRYLLPKLLMVGIAALLITLVALVIHAINQLPNAAITVVPKGLNAPQYQQLTKLLGSQATANVLHADLQSYLTQSQSLDWVGQEDIRRDWQQGLLVSVTPRQAVAKFGSEKLVDATGVVFKPADSSELHNPQLMQLQGENQHAVIMMQQVKQVSDWFSPLGLKIDEVIVTPRMAWLFRFNNGLRVLVDNDNTSEKLYRLSVMLQNQLKPQLHNLQTIDLRYKNGMAITKRAAPASGSADPLTTAHTAATTQPQAIAVR